MNKRNVWTLNLFLLALAAAFLFLANKVDSPTTVAEDRNDHNLPQIVKGMNLDKTFTFCDEPVPTDNFDVRERLDRELTVNSYWHSSTVLSIKKSRRFFPMIERIFTEEGVPTDLKYLCVAESALSNATSPAGARGLWQFMRGTGREYGLEINDEVDERNHYEKATRAAAKYLQSLRNRFGSWANAAAAYNMGGGNMNKRLREQEVDNYFDMNLNEETGRYYFRLVAIKEIMEHPREYGFYLEEEDRYPPLENYRTVEVSGRIESWGAFAKEYGTTYRMLKIYNPWLMERQLTNSSGKTYEIRVPA